MMNPARKDNRGSFSGSWPDFHASKGTITAMKATFPHVVLCFNPPHSTSYLQPYDVAVFRSFKSCIKAQVCATLAVLDGLLDDVVMSKAWRRQSSTGCAVTDLCDENKVWCTGWRLRAVSDDDFRDAVTEATALDTRDELFAKHITPQPAEEGPLVWAVAEESDGDEDGTPLHADADEPELIDMPPAPASAPPMSNLERCIALRLVYGAGPR